MQCDELMANRCSALKDASRTNAEMSQTKMSLELLQTDCQGLQGQLSQAEADTQAMQTVRSTLNPKP